MSWFNVWDGMKNKTCRYLLQRYLGQFLEEKLNLEQFNVELYSGRAAVRNVSINVKTLNELCETQGLGVEVTGGHIGLVEVTVPWNALMTSDTLIEFTDLCISLRPVRRNNDGSSMLESMWSSVSSSLQLAQDCLQNHRAEYENLEVNPQNNSIEGLEKFAQTIDNVLNRIKAKCTNTTIRLDYVLPGSCKGIAVIVKIKNLNYQNETENKMFSKDSATPTVREKNLNKEEKTENFHFLTTLSTHSITLEDIALFTEEFFLLSSKPNPNPMKKYTSDGFDLLHARTESFINTGNKQCSENSGHYKFETCSSSFSSSSPSSQKYNTFSIKDTENSDPEEDTMLHTKIYSSKSIPFANVNGTQKILIKMKQAQEATGPKVSLEIEIGSIYFIITPRQIHLILRFKSAFFCTNEQKNDELEQQRNYEERTSLKGTCELTAPLKDLNMTGVLGSQSGWTDASEETNDQIAHNISSFIGSRICVKNNTSSELKVENENILSDSDSLYSFMRSSSTTCSSNYPRKMVKPEYSGDISSFDIRATSIKAVLLHEDILMENETKTFKLSSDKYCYPLRKESELSLLEICDNFFSCAKKPSDGFSHFICKKSHFKLQVGAISAGGLQQRSDNTILTKFKISVSTFSVDEVLEEVSKHLLFFGSLENEPKISISLVATTPSFASDKIKSTIPPHTECKIVLESCEVELDVTIYDRLSAFLCRSPFTKLSLEEGKNLGATDFNISSTKIDFKLRFPLADKHPAHDPNRFSWRRENIRPDYLVFSFLEMRLKWTTLIEIDADEINIFYCENSTLPRVHLIKSNFSNISESSLTAPIIKNPKIFIEKQSKEALDNSIQLYTDDIDNGEGSEVHMEKNFNSLPFSSRRVCRQSDTCHPNPNGTEQSETILLPGESQELKMFCDRTMNTSILKIKCSLPVAFIQINSKQLYEIIYNRLHTDLLMWVPESPNLKAESSFSDIKNNLNMGEMDSYSIPCNYYDRKKNIFNTINSATTEISSHPLHNNSELLGCGSEKFTTFSEMESESMYFSTCQKKNTKRERESPTPFLFSPSFCSLELFIGKGTVTLLSPVRDSENRVLPGQLGEFTTIVDGFNVFYVNGFRNDKDLSYLCLQSKSMEIYHCALIPSLNLSPPLQKMNFKVPDYMLDLIYPTPLGSTKGKLREIRERDMVSMVIEINKSSHEQIKRLKITAGIQRATLRHRPVISPHLWLNQLVDFFDILDYPTDDYKEFGIVTEVQLHFWDCAIDYRPRNFNYRGMVELSSFVISSNIISFESGCTLRFIVEDCIFSLAPYESTECDNKTAILSSSNLVPVLNIGLVDISLRLNDKSTGQCSKLDLRTSIHDVHISTCSDSARALAQLIGYFANDGDLSEQLKPLEILTSTMEPPTKENSELFLINPTKSRSPGVSILQQERINKLLAEATQETITSPVHDHNNLVYEGDLPHDHGVEVFFFPDEYFQATEKLEEKDYYEGKLANFQLHSQQMEIKNTSEYKNRKSELQNLLNFETSVIAKSSVTNEVKEELGDVVYKEAIFERLQHSDLDGDFCVIGNEDNYNVQGARKHLQASDEEINIIDNHFQQPSNKLDLLKCPDGFPIAEKRYTLCEITLTWHLFGGNDFPLQSNSHLFDDKDKKGENRSSSNKIQMSGAYNDGVSYSNNIRTTQCGNKMKKKPSRKIDGGINRNHNVLVEVQLTKVRFSHEKYPAYTAQASRQVLIVNELEIRDRLQTSDINKFLYHPRPKELQSNNSKHMVVIKALHVRPNFQKDSSQECSLRISILPLRLNIDQDTLLFLAQFCFEVSDSSTINKSSYSEENIHPISSHQTQPPVLLVGDASENAHYIESRNVNNIKFDMPKKETSYNSNSVCENVAEENTNIYEVPVYFREIVFSPEVLIRIDYHGHRVEMSRGPIAGLLMGLGQLQCSEIRLKKINFKHGILGIDNLITFLFKEWLNDIKKNQLPAILSGIGPTYAFVQLFQGLYDLFLLPIEQYQRDGRIIRGLQLGAQSFTARTALAALEITSRIIFLMQFTAETAFDMLSPGPSVRSRHLNRKGKRKRTHHPKNILEGVTNAYFIVKEGINDSASTLITAAAAEHDQKGYAGAVGAVVRQIPQLVLRPAVLATQASANILGGAKISLVPDAKIEAIAKWKEDSD